MAIRIKYDYWFVRAIVTSMANKRTTFLWLQDVKKRADTVHLRNLYAIPNIIIAVSAVVWGSRFAAVHIKQRYKFMEISI